MGGDVSVDHPKRQVLSHTNSGTNDAEYKRDIWNEDAKKVRQRHDADCDDNVADCDVRHPVRRTTGNETMPV